MAARKKMSAAHKTALAEGRKHSRAVRAYMEALEANRPKRGRKRTPESIRARLDHIAETIDEAAALLRLQLVQERMDLEAELAALESGNGVDIAQLEAGFVASAATYGESKGITYPAWRQVGVDAKVLKAAGIARTRT